MQDPKPQLKQRVAIIGGGPAGLMAAETLATKSFSVTVFERKPTLARKFLLAGRGGLNLTHSEEIEKFISRYYTAADFLAPMIRNFTPLQAREWCESLGQKTFIGTSGRVFPESFKASPLLRAWQIRLSELNVSFVFNHTWQGFDDPKTKDADATLLALGGASWPKLGADGSWVSLLRDKGIDIAPLRPANCGFCVTWSDIFKQKFQGEPLKGVVATFKNSTIKSEMVITEKGIEGGTIYALSAKLRDEIAEKGTATLYLNLKPAMNDAELLWLLKTPRGTLTFSNYLRKGLNLTPVEISLLREAGGVDVQKFSPEKLAELIKKLPLTLTAPFDIDRAISSAGGIRLQEIDENLMLKKLPGVFVAGEMVDWEAPTGGYLLQACLSMGVWAAKGIENFLQNRA